MQHPSIQYAVGNKYNPKISTFFIHKWTTVSFRAGNYIVSDKMEFTWLRLTPISQFFQSLLLSFSFLYYSVGADVNEFTSLFSGISENFCDMIWVLKRHFDELGHMFLDSNSAIISRQRFFIDLLVFKDFRMRNFLLKLLILSLVHAVNDKVSASVILILNISDYWLNLLCR